MLKTKQTNKKKTQKTPSLRKYGQPTVSCQLLTAYYLYCLLPILLTGYCQLLTAKMLLRMCYKC